MVVTENLANSISVAGMEQLLPPWIPSRETLDLSELAELNPELARTRRQLEADLGCHVAAYRDGAAGRPGGLCDLYESARLSESQLRRLREAEQLVGSSVFVAYAKPLTRWAPSARRTITVGGRRISRMGIGTLRLVGPEGFGWPPDIRTSTEALREAVTLGIQLVDTADAYGPEVAEELVARALHPYPPDLVIATKGGLERLSARDWSPNGRPEHLRTACEASLRRLRVDVLRLYQLHAVDPAVPIEESVGAMLDLQQEGKVEHIGLCNVSPMQYRRAKAAGTIASVQNRFNRNDESHREMVGICEQEGIPFIAWGPLDGGKLAKVIWTALA
jgi:diketogulonate reductase-like aldo/keto reductase